MTFVRWSVIDPDIDYPRFVIEAEADGFSAHTEVWLPRNQLRDFVRDLKSLDSTLRGRAAIEVDDGVSGSAAMTIQPYGHTGRLRVDLMLVNVSTDFGNEARLSFLLPEPNVLSRFVSEMTELASGTRTESAVLTPTHPHAATLPL